MFDVWMRLLSRVDDSVLWLSAGHAAATAHLRAEAERRGVYGERLVFAPKLPGNEDQNEDHLARHRLAGLFLDTLPCNAHDAAGNALRAGLPVVTAMGQTFAGRVCASMLHAAGLPELVTDSLAEYETLALKLATEPPLLQGLRGKARRATRHLRLVRHRPVPSPYGDGLCDDAQALPARRAARGLRGFGDRGLKRTEAFMGESRFITTQDGLRLHALDYGDRHSPHLPVVCLPGLTRTVEDFAVLAAALANDRRVLCLDYRGRGRSDYDPNPEHYAIAVETADVVTVMAALEAVPAIIVGTSRGGLIAMTLAADTSPSCSRGSSSTISARWSKPRGCHGSRAMSAKCRIPASYQEVAEFLRRSTGNQFPKLGAADWLAAAKRGWREEGGRLVTTYDPALARTLAGVSTPTSRFRPCGRNSTPWRRCR